MDEKPASLWRHKETLLASWLFETPFPARTPIDDPHLTISQAEHKVPVVRPPQPLRVDLDVSQQFMDDVARVRVPYSERTAAGRRFRLVDRYQPRAIARNVQNRLARRNDRASWPITHDNEYA